MSELIYLPVSRIFPHPDNPRKELGDLTELADSIKANGIYQNLTVVPFEGNYRAVIGHRRLAAAQLAGLTEVPCVVIDMTPKEQLQTMLLENMQRADLTVYEQAQGFQMMLDLGSTVEEISEKTGFSTTTVRRRVKMTELNQSTLKEVSARQLTLSDFDRLAQIEDIDARNRCLKEIGTSNFDQSVTTQLHRQAVKKNLPAVKKILKEAKATALKDSDTWSSKYDSIGSYIYIYNWDGTSPLIPKEITGKVYYVLSEQYGHLRFFEAHKRAKPVKKSAAEIEKQKRLNAVWEKVHELEEVIYAMRKDFVEGLSLNNKNMTAILKGAIIADILRCIDYNSPDRELYTQVLCVDDKGYSPQRAEQALTAFGHMSAKNYPLLIYANFGDGKKNSYVAGHSGEWPKYKKEAKLDALYTWLCSFGYQMSDEEMALQNGTHALFKQEDYDEPSA